MTRPADPVAFVGAVVSVVLLGMFLVALPKLAAAAGSFGDDSGGRGEPFEYVEARLLKWGEIKDKEALPDRIVPALPTAPEETLPLDRNENKAEPPAKPKKPARQRGAVTDEKLRQVFDKARAFAEIQDDFVPEGHPDGVPDGDVTDPALASMGATYGRRITRLIQERLMVPTLISEAQKNKLKAKIHLKFDIDMTIVSFKFIKKSGNALYDDAIQNAVDKVRIEVRNLPAPPEAIAPRVFGGGIVINLRGQDSPYE
ncbi:MAG: TonB C-terminal domain-containing protein [Myxococcota bacterium]|nr:TonB C-terminal domain-containing protein [Myxococcota bacterium]